MRIRSWSMRTKNDCGIVDRTYMLSPPLHVFRSKKKDFKEQMLMLSSTHAHAHPQIHKYTYTLTCNLINCFDGWMEHLLTELFCGCYRVLDILLTCFAFAYKVNPCLALKINLKCTHFTIKLGWNCCFDCTTHTHYPSR